MRTIVLVAVCISSAFGQTDFKQLCSTPKFPSTTATAIDSSCGPDGKGGNETHQNEAKNSFCASGPAKPISIADMANLQKQVESDKTIAFGNPDLHPLTTEPGPAVDRTHLVALGEGNEVVLTGFVKIARPEGGESVNCGRNVPNDPGNHDIHISIITTPGKAECTGVVAEMTPHHRPRSWTPDLVNAVAKAQRPVLVTGQLMFDSSHSPCVNGQPVRSPNASDPARISVWEVHPIYTFEVCPQGNCSSGGWVTLENWKQ